MKLFTYDLAPNPARLKMFLAYKDIRIETEQVDLTQRENLEPQYLNLVPEGTVPALVLNTRSVITSVTAICQYLEALNPVRPLFGRSEDEKVVILNWCHRLFVQFMVNGVAAAFRNSHPAYVNRALPGPKPYEQIPALADRGSAILKISFEQINKVLETQPFVAGNSFTMADIDLLAIVIFAQRAAKLPPDTSLLALNSWQQEAQKIVAV